MKTGIHPGKLVAVEGIDGSGKSTLVKGLARALRRRGLRVATLREPTKGRFGRMARMAAAVDPLEAALLFTLDRMSAREEVERLRATHDIVLSDRSFYSTLAYQGSLLPPRVQGKLRVLEESVAVIPDLVLWLDGPLELVFRRLQVRPGGRDGWERRRTLQRVGMEFRRLARKERKKFRRLDFSHGPQEMVGEALAIVTGTK